eukprot:4394161-Pleurochrysis_carterae.AAC.1
MKNSNGTRVAPVEPGLARGAATRVSRRAGARSACVQIRVTQRGEGHLLTSRQLTQLHPHCRNVDTILLWLVKLECLCGLA